MLAFLFYFFGLLLLLYLGVIVFKFFAGCVHGWKLAAKEDNPETVIDKFDA